MTILAFVTGSLAGCSTPRDMTDWPGAQPIDIPEDLAYALELAITPDGSGMALYGEVSFDLGAGGVYLQDRPTSIWIALAAEAGAYRSPALAWDQNRSRLMFYRSPNAMVYTPETGGLDRVTIGRSSGLQAWGPSADELTVYVIEPAATRAQRGDRVEVWGLKDQSVAVLLELQALNMDVLDGMAWSPDGRYLLLAGEAIGAIQDDLFLYDRSTGTLVAVATSESRDVHPSWSPDGRWYAYIEDPVGEVGATLVLAQFGSDCRIRKPASGLLTDVDWYGPNELAIVYVGRPYLIRLTDVFGAGYDALETLCP